MQPKLEHWIRKGGGRWRAVVECKFNPWHDPDDGRFTFSGQGRRSGALREDAPPTRSGRVNAAGIPSGANRTEATPAPATINSRKVGEHRRRRASANEAAVDIANKITGTPLFGPENPFRTPEGQDWTNVEFGAIVDDSGKDFGALDAAIYSNSHPREAVLPKAPKGGRGIVHNHTREGDVRTQLRNRHPSGKGDTGSTSDDWNALETFATQSGNQNPSLWIIGPDKVVREFKLSDKAFVRSLSNAQMEAGAGLAERVRK